MDFNETSRLYKEDILALINALIKNTKNYRIEKDDMKQEASIKLWQLSTQNPLIYNKSKVLIAIKNHLLDHIRKCRQDAIFNADSLEELRENKFNPRN